MKKQILCHNEFTIVGRVSEDIKMINDNSFRVLIYCPNDDDYNQMANKIYIDFDASLLSNFMEMIGHAIVVTGHIENNNDLCLISDMFKFIN